MGAGKLEFSGSVVFQGLVTAECLAQTLSLALFKPVLFCVQQGYAVPQLSSLLEL